MTWVNPGYVREVRDGGGITYRRKTRDIIDDIDSLVDDQLAGGEPRTGYDFGDPKFPRCHHCDRHWHGLAITERIAAMYAARQFDEDYRSDTDDSRVLCRGSGVIGPMPVEPPKTTGLAELGLTGTYLPAVPTAPWVVTVDDSDSPPTEYTRVDIGPNQAVAVPREGRGVISLRIGDEVVTIHYRPGITAVHREPIEEAPTWSPFDEAGNLNVDDGWHPVGTLSEDGIQ